MTNSIHKKIAVIGQGFVGGSLTTVLSERGLEVFTYDKAGKCASGGRSHNVSSVSELVRSCEEMSGFSNIYFVCLPTPMYEDGSADLTIVEGVLSELASEPGERIAVVKSTVPPGSTHRWNEKYGPQGLHVVFNPEFLTEANALNDMREQNRIILGGPRPWINQVKLLFQRAFPKVPLIKTSSTTAEMVKYLTNNFLTVKVAFANEIAQVCEALDADGLNIDYDKVVEYAKYDRRLGDSHWSVPGPDGARGYGGHCVVSGTKVTMSDSSLRNVEEIKPRDVISSANASLDESDLKQVSEVHARSYTGVVLRFTVSTDNEARTIECTPEHILPVKRNNEIALVRASDITTDDELFVI